LLVTTEPVWVRSLPAFFSGDLARAYNGVRFISTGKRPSLSFQIFSTLPSQSKFHVDRTDLDQIACLLRDPWGQTDQVVQGRKLRFEPCSGIDCPRIAINLGGYTWHRYSSIILPAARHTGTGHFLSSCCWGGVPTPYLSASSSSPRRRCMPAHHLAVARRLLGIPCVIL